MVSYRPTSQDYQRPPPQPGYPGSRSPKSRWLLYLLPVLAIFLGFGSIVWLAYLEGAPASALGDPPLIKAETTPIKLQPDDPGGSEVADRGAVGELLGEDGEPATERLLPPPEEPLETPSPEDLAAEASRLEDAVDDPTTTAQPDDDRAAQQSAQADPGADGEDDEIRSTLLDDPGPPADTEAAIRELFREPPSGVRRPEVLRPEPVGPLAAAPEVRENARQLTRTTQEAGSAEADEEPPAQAAPEPAQQGEAAPEQPAPSEESPADPEVAAASPPEERTVTPAVAPAARAPEPVDQALLEGPHFRVQLAAVRNEADAERAWDLFLVDYGEVLAGIDPIFERGETTNGVFYRVQLGPYASLERAEAMCEQLKERNASCFVLRR